MEGTQETVASSSEQNKTLVKPPVQALQFLHLITCPARKTAVTIGARRQDTRPDLETTLGKIQGLILQIKKGI